MKRLFALLLLAALAVALAAASGCSTRQVEAGLLLSDLGAGGKAATTWKRVTQDPERRSVTFTRGTSTRGEARRTGDLYLPGEKARAALVLVPGAAREGKDDPRLVGFANALARANYLVFVPDIASLRALEVSASDAQVIADAVHWLKAERKPPGVGIAAISYAAAPALLAALDPELGPQIDFVVAVGAVHDMTEAIRFFTTGHHREGVGAPWLVQEPNAYGKWVFVKSNARRLDDSADRALLAAIAQRKMADEAAPVDDLKAGLTAQGRSVMALLDNRDPARVPDLIKALPPRIRAEIEALDPSRRDLSRLHARLFLVHGRDDRIIPWTQSLALSRAVPRAELVLLDNLNHADLAPGRWSDAYILWRAVVLLLEERDRLAHGRP